MMMTARLCCVLFSLACFLAWAPYTHAASLTMVSDTIGNSAPATSTMHTIQFTATNAIPASGKILITPAAGALTIPSAFDYTDVDLAVSSSDRSLAASASAANDGVAVVTGSSGSITITLNATTGIGAGSVVEIQLGTIATAGVAGDQNITNTASTGSYRIALATKDQLDATIDTATAMIAIISQVTVTGTIVSTAPVRSNGRPSGAVEANHPSIEIALDTDNTATCRYATTTGVDYDSMTNTFTVGNSSSTIHHKTIDNHQNNTTYNYYVRCITVDQTKNTTDYAITFTLNPTPEFDSSVTLPSAGPGGAGTFRGGSSLLHLSTVNVSGWSSPLSTVTILRDGKIQMTTQAGIDGNFKAILPSIERGTYTFMLYADDVRKRRSASFSSTLAIAAGTSNSISNVVLAPTFAPSKTALAVGESFDIVGESVPGSTVEVFIRRQGSSLAEAKKFTATASKGRGAQVPDGSWVIAVNGKDFSRGTYDIRARTVISSQLQSELSGPTFIGVGESAARSASSLKTDINGDQKVNLVDFSIMLSSWGTNDLGADFSGDGKVNLADFSILLFNWTG